VKSRIAEFASARRPAADIPTAAAATPSSASSEPAGKKMRNEGRFFLEDRSDNRELRILAHALVMAWKPHRRLRPALGHAEECQRRTAVILHGRGDNLRHAVSSRARNADRVVISSHHRTAAPG